MLNFVYWPISAVLWFWHKIFGFLFSPDSGIAWILAIVFLTFTIRVVLIKPMVNQMRSMQKMQEMQPKMQEIRAKYGNDQQKMAMETQKLYKEMGTNPLSSCVVPLVQMPVFIGLFHVLRSFNRTGTGPGQLGMSVEENRNTANYIFSPELVQQFLDAKIFGVPLVANLRVNSPVLEDVSVAQAAVIIVPMIAIIATLTHFNARMSLDRQEQRRLSGKTPAPQDDNAQMMQQQMAMMSKMMLWVMPAMLIFSGFIWPIGLLFYMLANTVWTFFQTRIIYGKMDEEEAQEEEARIEKKRTSAPKPGARKLDHRTKKQRKQQNKKQN